MDRQLSHSFSYQDVAAGAGSTLLGTAGKVGQLLDLLVVTVTAAATSAVTLQDGNATAVTIVPANTPIGVYNVWIRSRARVTTTPGWRVTTGAGVNLRAIGNFGQQTV